MPYTDDQWALPFSGRSPSQRHNSYRAAVAQRATRGTKKLAMLAYIRRHGHVTDQGLAEGLGLPIQSVCSLRNALSAELLIEKIDDAIGKYGHRVSVYRATTASAQEARGDA